MNPGLELRIEELKPFLSNMKNQRATQEKMLETETSSNPSKVKKVSEDRIRVTKTTLNL